MKAGAGLKICSAGAVRGATDPARRARNGAGRVSVFVASSTQVRAGRRWHSDPAHRCPDPTYSRGCAGRVLACRRWLNT